MKKQLVLALALAAAPFVAFAGEQSLSYSYFEGGYSRSTLDFEVATLDLDGFALKGSMAFGDQFYGVFGMHKNELDGDNSLAPYELGLGYHKALGQSSTDFIGEVAYIGANSEVGGTDFHNDGYRAAVGVRGAVAKHLELGAKLTYTGVEQFDSVVGVNLNGHVKFNDTWGLVAEYHYNEYNFFDADIDSWQVGVRASF